MEHHNIILKTVSRETYKKTLRLYKSHESLLNTYLEQLLWWNKRVNLVSRNVSRETIREHVVHSLLLSQFKVFCSAKLIVDAGSGGGLPGIPLAVTHSKKKFLLNDIVSKKCLVMKTMIRTLGLTNVRTDDHSIEKLQQKEPFLLISKHAFKINDLYKMVAPLPWKRIILYKGVDFERELETIDEPLTGIAHDLSNISEFYKGKAIIIISRQ